MQEALSQCVSMVGGVTIMFEIYEIPPLTPLSIN